jgi:hypothetical protein
MQKKIDCLSDAEIRVAQHETNLYRLYDGDGLYLHITPSGGKWWRFKYRFNRKYKSLALGTYPEAGLEDARRSKDAAKELLTRGFDPSEIRKREKARDKADRLESARIPSVRAAFDGKIEIWKGNNTMRLTLDEARFIGTSNGIRRERY